MGDSVRTRDLVEWCRVPAEELEQHPNRRVPLRIVRDGAEMGRLMARELVDLIDERNRAGQDTRVIVPCGPSSWYAPWTEEVNRRGVSLARLHVFHMDECLDWQGQPLPRLHPYNFRSFMERRFYGGIADTVIQRIIEILRSIPTIPLWMGLAAAVPREWSVLQVYFAITVIISLLGWTELARVVRGRFLSMREEDFVVSARLVGCSQMRTIFVHMNNTNPILLEDAPERRIVEDSGMEVAMDGLAPVRLRAVVRNISSTATGRRCGMSVRPLDAQGAKAWRAPLLTSSSSAESAHCADQ